MYRFREETFHLKKIIVILNVLYASLLVQTTSTEFYVYLGRHTLKCQKRTFSLWLPVKQSECEATLPLDAR